MEVISAAPAAAPHLPDLAGPDLGLPFTCVTCVSVTGSTSPVGRPIRCANASNVQAGRETDRIEGLVR